MHDITHWKTNSSFETSEIAHYYSKYIKDAISSKRTICSAK